MPDLDSEFAGGIPLPDACQRAERALADGAESAIRKAVHAAHTTAAPRRDLAGRLEFQDRVFDCRVVEASADANRLEIAVGSAYERWQATHFEHREVVINGSGRYAAVDLRLDRALAPVADAIGDAVREHFESGFRRIEAVVMSELLAIEHRVATALYVEVRTALDEHQASRVGLYALLGDGRALYLLDPRAIQSLLSYASDARPSVGASPLALTSLLVRGWVLAEDTAAKQALADRTPLDVRLQDLRYSTAPGFDIAETALFGATAVVHPLVTEGPVQLLAGYPVHMRHDVGPKLRRIRPRLADILAAHAHETQRLITPSRADGSRRWSAQLMAELLGRFTGGFTDTLT